MPEPSEKRIVSITDERGTRRIVPPEPIAPPKPEPVEPKRVDIEKEPESKEITREEVISIMNKTLSVVWANFASKADMNAKLGALIKETSTKFATISDAERIAKDAVPPTLRNIELSPRTGVVLMLSPGGGTGIDSAYFGTPTVGLSVKGTKTLNYGIHAREYDSDGNLVDVGAETGGEDRTLKPTWDVARWI